MKPGKSASIAVLAVLSIAPVANTQTTRHVWTNSPNPNAGDGFLSWATAATNIQNAIDAAAPGDFIWVTNGVYNTGGTYFADNATNRVYINKAITLASVNGPSNTFIVGRWHVPGSVVLGPAGMRCVWMTTGATLTGFTITNGALEDVSWRYGPGVWCASTGCVISNCVLTGNNASMANNGYGAGAYRGTLYNCRITGNSCRYGAGVEASVLYDCNLIGNYAAYQGGGAEASILYDCNLSGNYGAAGGGGAYYGSLFNCTLTANSTAAANGSGGGAWRAVVRDSRFIGNYASFRGSAFRECSGAYGYASNCLVISNYGASTIDASTVYDCTIANNTGKGAESSTLYDCDIIGNSGTWGAGANGSTLYNCRVANNTNLTGTGGGFYNSTAYNCIITGNTANYDGCGGIALYNCLIAYNSAQFYGCGAAALYNCTVVGNSAWSTAAYNTGGANGGTIVNSIIYNNTCPFAANSNYYNGSFSYSCTAPLPAGAGNTDANPLFADFGAGLYRLTKTSQCFNHGLNLSHMTDPSVLATNAWLGRDLDGGPRIRHNTVDMGAYELRAPRGSLFSAE